MHIQTRERTVLGSILVQCGRKRQSRAGELKKDFELYADSFVAQNGTYWSDTAI